MGFLLQATPCTFGRNSFKTLGVKVFLSSRVSDGVLNFLSFSTSSWFNATWCTNLKSRSPSCPSSFTALMISAAHFTRDTVFPQIVSTMCFFHLAWHPARENQPSTLHGLVLPVHHFFLIPVPCREACSPTLTGFVPMISLWGIHLISQQILPVTGARLSRARHSQRNEGLREVVKVPEGWLVAYATLRFHLYLTHCTSSMYSWQHPTQLLIDSPGGWSGYFRRLANKIDSSFSPTYQYFEAIPNNKRGNLYNL